MNNKITPEDLAQVEYKLGTSMLAIMLANDDDSIKRAVHELREILDIIVKYDMDPDLRAQFGQAILDIAKLDIADQSLFAELAEMLPYFVASGQLN